LIKAEGMNARNQILAPLLVMILLTFLVGGTAYEQILTWKNGVGRVADHVSELVILNKSWSSIRNKPRRAGWNYKKSPAC
jgi:hypothetical protein